MSSVSINFGYQSICSINNSDWHLHDFDAGDYTGEIVLGSDVVIPAKSIKIVIDYPVENPAEYEHTSENGFTRKQLAELIVRDY